MRLRLLMCLSLVLVAEPVAHAATPVGPAGASSPPSLVLDRRGVSADTVA